MSTNKLQHNILFIVPFLGYLFIRTLNIIEHFCPLGECVVKIYIYGYNQMLLNTLIRHKRLHQETYYNFPWVPLPPTKNASPVSAVCAAIQKAIVERETLPLMWMRTGPHLNIMTIFSGMGIPIIYGIAQMNTVNTIAADALAHMIPGRHQPWY